MRLDEASRAGQRIETSSGLPVEARWQGRRAGIFSAARLAWLRAARSRWLLLVVALGILVADVLICTVPLYNTLVSDIQLQSTLSGADSITRNMQISVRTQHISRSLSQDVGHTVGQMAGVYLNSIATAHPTAYTVGGVMALKQAGSHVPATGNLAEARMEAFDYAAIQPYLHFVAGAPPQTAAAGQPIQVIITTEMAKTFDLAVGQPIGLAAPGTDNIIVTAVVTGIFEPINVNDPFWNGLSFSAGNPDPNGTQPQVFPLLTTSDSFFNALSDTDTIDMTQSWVYYTDTSRITTSNMEKVAENVITFRTYLTASLQDSTAIANVLIQGSLDHLIQEVEQQLSLITLPLYVIAAQIVGLALLFVAAMAGLLIEQQGQEIATLKSRGTSSLQLLGIFSTQSALLGLLAAVAGPVLAAGLAVLLIRWFLPGAVAASGLSARYLTGVATPQLVVVPALVGAVLGVGVVTLAALAAARLDVLAFRRELARPGRAPFWRRAYLDVGLALLCVVGYLELGQFGGTATRLELGEQANSPLLLLTPALLLLAGGLLSLRLIPLLAGLGARLAGRGRGIVLLLACAQIARTPARYGRMALLLVLAVGLGLFALTFDASLGRNVHDRTTYAAGADLRLILSQQISAKNTDDYLGRIASMPGVEKATPVYRTLGSTSDNVGNLAVDMLGVDASSFASVADPVSWRSDYAAQSLPSLMAQLQAHRGASGPVAAANPLWAIVSDTLAQQLRLKVGYHFQLSISDVPFSNIPFVVGAIVHDFPTLYPQGAPGGFIVVDLHDLQTVIATNLESGLSGGFNEVWLRTANNAGQQQELIHTLNKEQYNLSLGTMVNLRNDLQQAEANPTNGGMSGLLLIGTLTALLLAILGSLVQAVLAARQRTTQFAIFRTLGMSGGQVTRLLLAEQAAVYLFGLLGGTLLGLVLMSATWPYLTFSDAAVDPSRIGVPPYVLVINGPAVGIFYGALFVAFLLALLIAARYAATIGLGKALRLGED